MDDSRPHERAIERVDAVDTVPRAQDGWQLPVIQPTQARYAVGHDRMTPPYQRRRMGNRHGAAPAADRCWLARERAPWPWGCSAQAPPHS